MLELKLAQRPLDAVEAIQNTAINEAKKSYENASVEKLILERKILKLEIDNRTEAIKHYKVQLKKQSVNNKSIAKKWEKFQKSIELLFEEHKVNIQGFQLRNHAPLQGRDFISNFRNINHSAIIFNGNKVKHTFSESALEEQQISLFESEAKLNEVQSLIAYKASIHRELLTQDNE